MLLGPMENESGWKIETQIELGRTMNLICRESRFVHSNENCFSVCFLLDGSLNLGSLFQNNFSPSSYQCFERRGRVLAGTKIMCPVTLDKD